MNLFIIILLLCLCIYFLHEIYFYYSYKIFPHLYNSFSEELNKLNYINSKSNNYNIIFLYSYSYSKLPKYSYYSINILKKYCKLHNYQLLQINHNNNNNISPYWLRVYDLIKLSKIYDDNTIFIYNDLDTILNPYYFSIKINKLIDSIDTFDNNNYDMYISTDPLLHLNINTGVMFIKNTDYSKNLLNYWFKLYQPLKWINNNNKWQCYKYKNIPCIFAGYEYEQGALEYIYKNNILNSKDHIKILQPNISSNSNYNDDVFIYHFMGYKDKDRLQYMKSIYNRLLT